MIIAKQLGKGSGPESDQSVLVASAQAMLLNWFRYLDIMRAWVGSGGLVSASAP
jgi:hypothetical protein